ncbi:expressed unknown protein [Seminavis robusta]|uniref:Uncharacterized protein n=1 Tax=Seminavis robusta TaxID=568900 RepID=A0A9N8HYS8_9STRA|nr:expressed unknown protein [Seminavis robusta]|eukprot:Sro2629_g333040.1 n/a (147) ;mRNA; r:1162-1807
MRLDDFDISSGSSLVTWKNFGVAEETALSPSRDYCIQTLSEDALDVIRGPVSELKDALPEDPVEPPKKRKAAKLEASDDTDWAKELGKATLTGTQFPISSLAVKLTAYQRAARKQLLLSAFRMQFEVARTPENDERKSSQMVKASK